MHRRTLLFSLAGGAALAGAPGVSAAPAPSRFIEDMTWLEVRDAIAAGATTALIPTGGTEQNGPQMAIGKHNYVVRHCAAAIAAGLGDALVAPVLAYVPEGGFAPPEGHMNFPGTIGVSVPTFAAILSDAATSLMLAKFKLICFLGDHGESQAAQDSVARRLSRQWRGRGVRVANLARYYAANGGEDWLRSRGYSTAEIGTHAGLIDTAELMAVDPAGVRMALMRPQSWPAGPTGAAGDPTRATAALGGTLIELKIATGIAETRALQAAPGGR